jgi:hypothetical protein
MDLTIGSVRDALARDEPDPFRTAVQALRSEFDILDVAPAALKLAHEVAGKATVESEIPELSARVQRTDRQRAERTSGERSTHSSGPTDTIYFGPGTLNDSRAGDLVGAIAKETHLSGKEIGPIKVGGRFSLVGVPEPAADDVIEAMRKATIKGKKAIVAATPDDSGGTPREPRPSAVKPWERTARGKKQYGRSAALIARDGHRDRRRGSLLRRCRVPRMRRSRWLVKQSQAEQRKVVDVAEGIVATAVRRR